MIRLIMFGFSCMMMLCIHRLLKLQLQQRFWRICHTEVESHASVRGTLVQDHHTGEYYVK